MIQLHVGHRLEELDHLVRDAALAGGGEVDGARLLLDEGDELLRGLRRELRIGDDDHRTLGDLHERRDVGERIVLERIKRGVDRVARGNQRQRVAIRVGLDALLDAEQAAGAGPVLDDDLRAEPLGEPLRSEARDEVRAAAGGERHDDVHRLRRIFGLRQGRRGRDGCERREGEREKMSQRLHGFAPWACARIAASKNSRNSVRRP